MALAFADRVKEITNTTGTDPYELEGQVTGYQPFATLDTLTITYCCISEDEETWEIGEGTVSGTTISRDLILSSSTGTLINWGEGTKEIYQGLSAREIGDLVENAVYKDGRNVPSGWDNSQTTWDDVINNPSTNEIPTVSRTFYQSNDPNISYTVYEDDVWFNTDTRLLSKWDGSQWQTIGSLNTSDLNDDAGLGDSADWDNVTGDSRPYTFTVSSVGLYQSINNNTFAAGLFDENNSLQGGVQTPHTLRVHIYDRATKVWESHTDYDISVQATRQTLVSTINAIGNDKIIAITTKGDVSAYRFDDGLEEAIYGCGGSRSVWGSPNFKAHGAYILVSYGSLPEGTGTELYAGETDNDLDGWIETSFTIINGNIALSSVSTGDAIDISYEDGTTLQDLQPAAAGATADDLSRLAASNGSLNYNPMLSIIGTNGYPAGIHTGRGNSDDSVFSYLNAEKNILKLDTDADFKTAATFEAFRVVPDTEYTIYLRYKANNAYVDGFYFRIQETTADLAINSRFITSSASTSGAGAQSATNTVSYFDDGVTLMGDIAISDQWTTKTLKYTPSSSSVKWVSAEFLNEMGAGAELHLDTCYISSNATTGATSVQQNQITEALYTAQAAQATADGTMEIFDQPTAPSIGESSEGDLWRNSDTGDWNRYTVENGWQITTDNHIGIAIHAASTANALADGKINTYYQDTPPTGLTAANEGDLWYDLTNLNEKWNYWTGTEWVILEPSTFQLDVTLAPTITSGTDALLLGLDGSIRERIRITWTPSADISVDGYEVQAKKTSSSTWLSAGLISGRSSSEAFFDAQEGESYVARVRAYSDSPSATPSNWETSATHVAVGKTQPPSNVSGFTVTRQPDGTREFGWTPVTDVDLAGYKIRWFLGSTTDWNAMTELHNGILVASPFETNQLAAGVYTVAIKAVDRSGNESQDATFISSTLGDPRIKNAFIYVHSHLNGWNGTKTNCEVDDFGGKLVASPNYTWDNLTTWDAWDAWASPSFSSIAYETEVIDLGVVLTYSPLVTVVSTGQQTIEVRTSNDNISWSGWSVPSGNVTSRYFQARCTLTQVASEVLYFTSFTTIASGEVQQESINDVDTSTLGGDLSTGRIIPLTKSYSAIVSVQVALQNVGAGWTWEIINKNTSGPTIKIYNGSGVSSDALIDVEIKGYDAI